jgi:hypothetical protein
VTPVLTPSLPNQSKSPPFTLPLIIDDQNISQPKRPSNFFLKEYKSIHFEAIQIIFLKLMSNNLIKT